jgi:import inner membrane translocase subunit TIM23
MNSYLPPSEKKMFSLEGDDKANRGMLTSFPSVPSPYLNYDPQLLPQSSQPEYIFLEGAGSKQRGRFELSFTEIGTSCLIGATIGGIRGVYSGIKLTSMENQTSTYNRTQILNSVFKNGARLSNTFGTLSVYYSIFGIILEKTRGCEDELNTIVAGTSTGLLYKATSGLRRCGIGGLIGFSLATAFSLITSRDKIKEMGKNVFHS